MLHKDLNPNITVTNNKNYLVHYLILDPKREAGKRVSAKITAIICNEFKDVFFWNSLL